MTALVVVGCVLAYVLLIFVFGSLLYLLDTRVLGEEDKSVKNLKDCTAWMIVWPVAVPVFTLALPWDWYTRIYSKRPKDYNKVTLAQRWVNFLNGQR